MSQKTRVIIGVLVFLVFAGGAVFMVKIVGDNWKINNPVQSVIPSPKIPNKRCTEKAKICPDGSVVGRTAPNCEFAPCPVVSNEEAAVYRNEQYGFEFALPKGYYQYKVTIEKNNGRTGVDYLRFLFPIKDSEYPPARNFVTGETFPGYADIFVITAWTQEAYAKAQKECAVNPSPDCPGKIIGENKGYKFDLTTGNGLPPKELEGLADFLNTKDSAKNMGFQAFN